MANTTEISSFIWNEGWLYYAWKFSGRNYRKTKPDYIFVDKFGVDNFFRYFHDLSADKWYKSHSILPQDFNKVLSKCDGLKILNIIRKPEDAMASRFYYSYKNAQTGVLIAIF